MAEVSSTNLLVQAAAKAQHINGSAPLRVRDLPADKFESESKKRQLSLKEKLGLTVGFIGTLAAVYAVAVHSINRITPKKLQKMFCDIYMRDDLTVEDAKNIAKKFKELDKIKDKEEYADKAFEYVKKLFGFEDKPIELRVEKTSKKSVGGCHIDNSEINIKYDDKITNSHILALIHHELRHAKQHWLVFNQYPDIAKNVLLKPILKKYLTIDSEISRYVESLIGSGINVVDELIKLSGEKFSNTIDERIIRYFGRLSPDNVPQKYKAFAQKCLENLRNYVRMEDDDAAYRAQFIENDAYSIQKQILKIFDWYKP